MARGVIALNACGDGAGWTEGPPALTPVANRSLLRWAIDALRAAGARTVMVAGDEAALAAAEGEVTAADAIPLALTGPVSTADALVAGADLLRGERILVHSADGLVMPGAERPLGMAAADESSDATVFFRRRALTGVGVFSDSILGALAATPPGEDGRRSLLDAVDRLAAGGGRVQAGVLEGWWAFDADADRLLTLNRVVLDALGPAEGEGDADTRLEGRVQVHPTARLVNAVVRGPTIIGAHACVTDAYVGPYTTVGDGATIENSEIEGSIVLPRARIRHVGVRVEGSIIGSDAVVGRDFSLPRALRLRIGAGASVSVG